MVVRVARYINLWRIRGCEGRGIQRRGGSRRKSKGRGGEGGSRRDVLEMGNLKVWIGNFIPVAIKSSTTTTLSSLFNFPFCISKTSSPYSLTYFACTHSPGNFPRFRMGMKRTFKRRAKAGAKMKPLASSPTMTVGFRGAKWDS